MPEWCNMCGSFNCVHMLHSNYDLGRAEELLRIRRKIGFEVETESEDQPVTPPVEKKNKLLLLTRRT